MSTIISIDKGRIVSTIIPVDMVELTKVKYFIQKFKLQNNISPHFFVNKTNLKSTIIQNYFLIHE